MIHEVTENAQTLRAGKQEQAKSLQERAAEPQGARDSARKACGYRPSNCRTRAAAGPSTDQGLQEETRWAKGGARQVVYV